MAGGARPESGFRVSPVDRLGRRICLSVQEAAEEIARRAVQYAERLLVDPAIAASLLEEAAATVSRALDAKKDSTQKPIRDLRAYLFRAFIRRVNRVKKRQSLLANAALALSISSNNSTDPQKQFEMKILIDELLTRGNPIIRDMFYRRVQGFSWKEIGLSYDISSHAAESRFSQALQKIRKRLGRERGS